MSDVPPPSETDVIAPAGPAAHDDGTNGDGHDDGRGYNGNAAAPRRAFAPYIIAAGIVAALVAGLVVGLLLGSGSDDDAPATASLAEPATLSVVDVFDEVGDTPASPLIGPDWFVVSGSFAVDEGGMAVTDTAADASLAVVDTRSPSGDFEVVFGAVGEGDGVIFRYRDIFNHWRLVASPELAAWNLEKVVDGTYEFVQSIGPASVDPGTTVGVQQNGTTLAVVIDGVVRVEVDDPDLADASAAGIFADGDTPKGEVRWTSFVHLVRTPLAPPTEEPNPSDSTETPPPTDAPPLFPIEPPEGEE